MNIVCTACRSDTDLIEQTPGSTFWLCVNWRACIQRFRNG